MRAIHGRVAAATLALLGALLLPAATGQAAATPAGAVVINELYYHAQDDNPAAEWIELLNPTQDARSLQGWCIDGVDFCFGTGASIGPGAIVVVAAPSFGGGLSNGGERLRLRDAVGAVIDEVAYDDSGLWPAMADGEGQSLQRRNPTQPGNDPGNWAAGQPSPWAANTLGGRMLPYFDEVEHTVLPAPGAPVVVTTRYVRGTSAVLAYRIGFGGEVLLQMTARPDGRLTATIPGQVAGALVRYRLVDASAVGDRRRIEQTYGISTWPVQGDGAVYTGTTVAPSSVTTLPRFEWFIDDATYTKAVNDLTLRGDAGYPCVVAYGGEIFDNTLVRVKGQVSRTFTKKKWKFTLAAGHELEIPGLLPEPVDEWAMHSAWNEKSFMRETLASELLAAAGVASSQAFPARLERNGQFYGLYTYLEQQDGSWRDRNGFTDDYTIYEVGGGTQFGLLLATDATLSQNSLRAKYDKETREWENDNALRTLISSMNSLTGAAKKAWIYRNVDVPSVVNALAVSMVMQHHDWGHKNYRLILTPQGKWQVVPTDFDLTFGRKATFTRGPFEDFVAVKDPFEHPGTPLFNPFWFDAELDSLVDRRVRSLTEELLNPAFIEGRIAYWNDQIRADAALDRATWGTYGEYQVAETAGWEINGSYVAQRRRQIMGTHASSGRISRNPNPAIPDARIVAADAVGVGGNPEHVVVQNFTADTLDLSGYRIDALDLVVPGGTVLRPGVAAVFAQDTGANLSSRFGSYLYGGVYGGAIDDAGELLVLTNPAGDEVNRFRHGPEPAPPPLFDVVVNEVSATGDAVLDDEGEVAPWFELFNRAPTSAALGGAVVTGDGGTTWTLPIGTTIAPGAHLRVVADGEPSGAMLHAPALLNPAGGTLGLTPPTGGDPAVFTYGAALTARTPSGSPLIDSATPTPGATNPLPRARVVLNEYNGVAPDKTLKNGGSDTYFGAVVGNGGDWLELVVVTDHVDLRGWTVRVVDNAGAPQDLVLPSDAGLADVPAGTIVTITDNSAVPTDLARGGGDTWINLQVPTLDVSNNNTQVTLLDAGAGVVFGPAGEGVHPLVGGGGVGSDEVLRLDASPTFTTQASGPYIDAVQSSFGSPNPVSGGATQDFAALLDTSRPGTPRLLGFDGMVPVLTWDPPIGTATLGFRIYRNDALAATTAALGYRDGRVREGSTVTYQVAAILPQGGTGPRSAGLTVSIPDPRPPVLAGTVTVSDVVGNAMRLQWPAATDAVGVAQYRVYANGHLLGVAPGDQPWFDAANLPDAVSNTIEVYAIDAGGNRSLGKAFAVIAVGDGTPPGPLRSVSQSVGRTTVRVSWGLAADVSTIVSYRVVCVQTGQTINTTNHSATFSGLTPNTQYTFHVMALDSKGNLGHPAVVIVRTAV